MIDDSHIHRSRQLVTTVTESSDVMSRSMISSDKNNFANRNNMACIYENLREYRRHLGE